MPPYENTLRAPKASNVSLHPLEEIPQRIEDARTRVMKLTDAARNAADDIWGSRPMAGETEATPARIGRFGNILDNLEYLHNAITVLEAEVERLTTIVPSNVLSR